MKKLIWGVLIGFGTFACQEQEAVDSKFTGNETVYALQQASDYTVSGTVTIKEKNDGSAWIEVSLSGTEGTVEHPVHLHMGDITRPDADVAALLTPVVGMVGISETDLTQLADETTINYRALLDLNACIKVHLAASGPDRDIILVGGNIGAAALKDVSTGRAGIGLCKSE
jgi:hypothetical protein